MTSFFTSDDVGPDSDGILSLNFKGIDSIGTDLPAWAARVTTLSLNYNNMKSLAGIERFISLRRLHLNYNRIASFQELLRVPRKENLVELSIQGNPVLSKPSIFKDLCISFPKYRGSIIR